MISEGSCDSEDWSNDAENTSLHRKNEWHFSMYKNKKQLFENIILFHNNAVFAVFFSLSNECSLGKHDTFLSKTLQNYIFYNPNFWTVVEIFYH